MLRIFQANTPSDYAMARELFTEYAEWLGHDLCFQNFAAELADLPGVYAPPAGCLLLATVGPDWAGCVAMRRFGADVCEMKRLYVRPAFRARGIGQALAREVIRRAQAARYERMCLDTLDTMTAARTLYRSLGFRETAAYYDNPLPGVVYYERSLV